MISITKQEYFNLKCSALKLEMLCDGGVDNWSWYGEALNPDDEPSYSDLVDELEEEILGEVRDGN